MFLMKIVIDSISHLPNIVPVHARGIIAASVTVRFTCGSPIVLLDVVENDLYNLRPTPHSLTHRLRQKLHSLGLRGLVSTSVPFDFYKRHNSSPHI